MTAPPAIPQPVGRFAFADASGTRLLALGALGDPARVPAAVCEDGRRISVEFVVTQSQRPADNGRQTSDNFENQAGDVFRLLDGVARQDETCFLSPDTLLLLAATGVNPPDGDACPPELPARIAAARGREVVHCWPLAGTPAGEAIIAAQFATVDTSALASVVVAGGGDLRFHDLPGVYRGPGQDVWRVEDGGEFSPEGFKVLFVAEWSGWYALALLWAGAEGEADLLLVAESDNVFREVVRDYRYWVPL